MSRLLTALADIARHELQQRPYCELAVVTSVFDAADGDDSCTVSIKLKDSDLALPRVPVASQITGGAALPREGDVVLVLFPRGDLTSAVIAGQVYSDQRRPPSFDKDELKLVWPGDTDDVEAKAIDISIRADGNDRKLTVTLGGDRNARLELSDGALKLSCGGITLELGHSSSSDATAVLSGGGTRVSLAQDGDLTLETTGKLTLKGREVAISGDTKISINGQNVEIN